MLKYCKPVTVINISFPPSRCKIKISYNLSSPEFNLHADLLSTYISNLVSHFSPKHDK